MGAHDSNEEVFRPLLFHGNNKPWKEKNGRGVGKAAVGMIGSITGQTILFRKMRCTAFLFF